MRIDPEQQAAIVTRTRATSQTRTTERAFASTLAAVRDATTTQATATSEDTRPLAERWGEWGQGATTAGYGPPPDPAEFAAFPVGADAPASPLNPRGNTTPRPSFTVPGFTARGTPIPPGFYNLAYYNQYLREGGTPLIGFEAYDPSKGTLTDVYGTFGDGQERATSYLTGLVDTGASTAAAGALAESRSTAEPTQTAAAPQAAAEPTQTAVPSQAVEPTTGADAPSAASEAVDAPATAAAALQPQLDPVVADAARNALRLALQTLLDDLLRIA